MRFGPGCVKLSPRSLPASFRGGFLLLVFSVLGACSLGCSTGCIPVPPTYYSGDNIRRQIVVDCKFMRGPEVAKAFGYPEEWGRKSDVYVCGFVRHTAGCRAYVTLKIDAEPEFSLYTNEFNVNLVPPRMSAGTPFLVDVPHCVDKGIDVSKAKPNVHVVKVWYK